MPPNRAAKRLGRAIGSAHLAVGAVALTVGAAVTAQLLVSLGTLALFVAATGICVPSLLYTLAFGPHRATAAPPLRLMHPAGRPRRGIVWRWSCSTP